MQTQLDVQLDHKSAEGQLHKASWTNDNCNAYIKTFAIILSVGNSSIQAL